jgi:hypothetical protein
LKLAKISRISTIFYFGLEGIGGLNMETDENENVSLFSSFERLVIDFVYRAFLAR